MSDQPSIDATCLTTGQYLAFLDADLDATLAAAIDLSSPVPGCPEWTVHHLLSHLVGVYRYVVAGLDTGTAPELKSGSWGDIAKDADVREVLRHEHARLRDRLGARGSDSPAWTWWPAEQTAGFWHRRIAQETAVHRWDAESAVSRPEGARPIDAVLASDGIDEMLGWLTTPWDDHEQPEAEGHTVAIATDGHAWTVSLHPTIVFVTSGSADAQAVLGGPAPGLLLRMWGRPGDHGVTAEGDTLALDILRRRLAALSS
ncbi:MAG: maleylpyruvate isomerase family mycothiol-dependent enzyme [Actinobacteria bacterium]|nr:maleylpyruvate isomerase family mycothiol-dependent enzyme [Actinomycetota bacterium]